MHVMIDNETMGIGPTSAIIQIGATTFLSKNEEYHGDFERTINLQSCLMLGCTIDADTINWWKNQSERAKIEVCKNAVDVKVAMTDFCNWFKKLKTVDGVWSHGASFDIPQIEFILKQLGMEVPWKYSAVRDTRTVLWLAEHFHEHKKREREVAHTALKDAIEQVKDIESALIPLVVKRK